MLDTAALRIVSLPSFEEATAILAHLDRLLGVLESLNMHGLTLVPVPVEEDLRAQGVKVDPGGLTPSELIERVFDAQHIHLRARRRAKRLSAG